MKKLFFAFLLCLLCSNGVVASVNQISSVSFHVRDAETHEPIIGASIIIKGSSICTITDVDGNAVLPGLKSSDVFVVSYVGYRVFSDSIVRQGRSVYSFTIDLVPIK